MQEVKQETSRPVAENKPASQINSFADQLGDDDLEQAENPQKGEQKESAGDADALSWLDDTETMTRSYVSEKGWKTPKDIIAAYQKVEQEIDRQHTDALIPPDLFSTQEEVDRFARTIGRPDDLEGYGIDNIEGMGEKGTKVVLSQFHEAMLNPTQAKILAEKMSQQYLRQMKERRDNLRKATEEFRRDSGDQYEANLKLMKEGKRHMKLSSLTLDNLQAIEDPRKIMDFIVQVGRKSRELGPVPTRSSFRSTPLTKDDIERKINELQLVIISALNG